jgi:hypothetical protein
MRQFYEQNYSSRCHCCHEDERETAVYNQFSRNIFTYVHSISSNCMSKFKLFKTKLFRLQNNILVLCVNQQYKSMLLHYCLMSRKFNRINSCSVELTFHFVTIYNIKIELIIKKYQWWGKICDAVEEIMVWA